MTFSLDDLFTGFFRYPLDTPYAEMKPHEQAFWISAQCRLLADRIERNNKKVS